ncbi:MAG TPA: PP2C family protein-serine/threonine phosphatase [Terracidiphilus sp.]|nr:PP2C family protein-serine/threonine phosphatase [Terracidiphilus sp.]
MRWTILSVALAAICWTMQLLAQAAHPHPGHFPDVLLVPHRQSGPAPSKGPSTPATIFDATSLGSPLLLDKGWRVGITADTSAAAPEFDDSAWATRDAQSTMEDVPDENQTAGSSGPDKKIRNPASNQRRFAWFRLHIKLAPNHGPLSLLIELPVSQNTSLGIGSTGPGVDVFANGKPVNPEGPHADAPQHYQQISRIYDLTVAPSETSLILVVRTLYIPFGYSSYTSFFANRSLHLGNRDDLNRSLDLWSAQSLFERLPPLVDSILLVVLALFLLALFFAQKGHIEYLWLALHELLQAPIGFVELAGSSARLDSLWYAAVVLQLVLVSAYVYFEFLIAFLALRPKKWYVRWHIKILRWTAPILAGVGPTLLLVGHSQAIGVVLALVLVWSFFWILGWLIFIFITLIMATLRRNFEAGLLLIPLVLTGLGIIEPVFAAGMSDWSGRAYNSPLTLQAGPIPIHFASIADFTGILVIVLIIFVRFLRIHRDQERVSSELAAARSVQELMIPLEKLATPGFEVDSIYSPANEVGGDFFHVQSTGDGGLLVVIGDVAGKGLKAAMNVSMLMGALRRTPEQSPAKILESLNRVLTGSDSFTTCQAAWFGANGELALANAGHLPPYLNSQEIALPGALPLGVLPDMRYEEVRLYLHPGDRILLLSDGVVEARRSSGEIFGFDRVHNLSNQSAFYVAEAAKDFGQEDDITVLTVRRLAQTKAA